ncbi:hypothetical protein AVEN_72187-1 [Araneus ventricosus]|uniref:Uncharacterized protein n=1 Tax=Araneus ventricosus TaxID=182803 RepID=A0A4Y2EKT6_ARAVE|nr:hypothetical protein AVEN_72187-1 [Araneus ventricosus]
MTKTTPEPMSPLQTFMPHHWEDRLTSVNIACPSRQYGIGSQTCSLQLLKQGGILSLGYHGLNYSPKIHITVEYNKDPYKAANLGIFL